jgi:protein-L-isoaspartate(D-aspartate) O-methyltransferase
MRVACLLGFLVALLGCQQFVSEQEPANAQEADEFKKVREQMVEGQIRSRGINDGDVIRAMSKVSRHKFVPPGTEKHAYKDTPLSIGLGQTISQPYIVAYMTDAADISNDDKVLEIGTGSGYQAAILGEIAKEVYTIEIIPELAERSTKVLNELGYKNVFVKHGNGYLGWPEHAPFDAIIVTAAPDEIPQALVDQLAVGGKMVVPVGTTNQEMVIISKSKKGVTQKKTMPVRFVPMTGKPST